VSVAFDVGSVCYAFSRMNVVDPRVQIVLERDYDDNGVDRTLVRRNLALTPTERVRAHDALLADVERFARAGEAARNGRP
jgi:hypothetical protein